MTEHGLENLYFDILSKLIEYYYPKIIGTGNREKYNKQVAMYHLFMFNNDDMQKIKKIDGITTKNKFMEENKNDFFKLVNLTNEIVNNENFSKPYLEEEQFEKIINKYNL